MDNDPKYVSSLTQSWDTYWWVGEGERERGRGRKKITVRDKKKSPPLWYFFSFDHIFIIPCVWVENLISFESWDFEFFHGMKIFFVFWRYLSYHFLNKNHVFSLQIQKYHFSCSDQKNFSFVKTSSSTDNFAKKVLG